MEFDSDTNSIIWAAPRIYVYCQSSNVLNIRSGKV